MRSITLLRADELATLVGNANSDFVKEFP